MCGSLVHAFLAHIKCKSPCLCVDHERRGEERGKGEGGYLLRVTVNAGSVHERTRLRWRFGLISFFQVSGIDDTDGISVFLSAVCTTLGVRGGWVFGLFAPF